MMNLNGLDKGGFGQMMIDPSHSYYRSGGPLRPASPHGSDSMAPAPMQPQQPQGIPDALAAYFAQVRRPNNMSPIGGGFAGLPYDPNQAPPSFQPSPWQGGMGQMGQMQPPMRGGQMGGPPPMMSPMQQGGINPGGMYFPQNPGGFAGLRNLGFGGG